jgi:hypothetical protein
LLGIRNLKPHGAIISAETRLFRIAPAVIPGKGLRGHETLFRRWDVIGGHLEDAFVSISIGNSPLDESKTSNVNSTMHSAHLSEIACYGFHNEVCFAGSDRNGTPSIKTDSEEIQVISNVGQSDEMNIAWRAGLETVRHQMGDTFRSYGATNMRDLWESILVEADMREFMGQKGKQSIRELRDRIQKRIRRHADRQ